MCLSEKLAQSLFSHQCIVMLAKQVLELFGFTKEADGRFSNRGLCQFCCVTCSLPFNANLMEYGISRIQPVCLYGSAKFFERYVRELFCLAGSLTITSRARMRIG